MTQKSSTAHYDSKPLQDRLKVLSVKTDLKAGACDLSDCNDCENRRKQAICELRRASHGCKPPTCDNCSGPARRQVCEQGGE